MKIHDEALRAKMAEIERRIDEARAEIGEAEAEADRAGEELAERVAIGEGQGEARARREAARKRADEIAEEIALLEAGRSSALRPLAEAVMEAAPGAVAEAQAAYDAGVRECRTAWAAFLAARKHVRQVESGADWIREAIRLARDLSGSKLYYGLNTVDIEKEITQP